MATPCCPIVVWTRSLDGDDACSHAGAQAPPLHDAETCLRVAGGGTPRQCGSRADEATHAQPCTLRGCEHAVDAPGAGLDARAHTHATSPRAVQTALAHAACLLDDACRHVVAADVALADAVAVAADARARGVDAATACSSVAFPVRVSPFAMLLVPQCLMPAVSQQATAMYAAYAHDAALHAATARVLLKPVATFEEVRAFFASLHMHPVFCHAGGSGAAPGAMSAHPAPALLEVPLYFGVLALDLLLDEGASVSSASALLALTASSAGYVIGRVARWMAGHVGGLTCPISITLAHPQLLAVQRSAGDACSAAPSAWMRLLRRWQADIAVAEVEPLPAAPASKVGACVGGGISTPPPHPRLRAP